MVNINWTLFWEVFNFLLLLWLLKRYLYGPINTILEKRAENIRQEIDAAETAHKEADNLKEKYQAEISKARKEAQEIIEDAELRGKRQAKEIINKARQEADRIKESKLQELNQAKKEALLELRKEIASISLMVAGKLLQEKLDRSKHEILVNQYIQELNQQRLGEIK